MTNSDALRSDVHGGDVQIDLGKLRLGVRWYEPGVMGMGRTR
ncbi:hypothetical protein [Streptomyces sp. NPDC051218]